MHVLKTLGYLLFIGVFLAEIVFCALNFEKIASLQLWQLVLVGLAAFRGGRAISYNGVFAWLREPFCQVVDDSSGAGESVEPRSDHGPFWYAVGHCLSCPICTSTHVGSMLLSLIAVWQPLGLVAVYALAAAGIAEGIHWWAEKMEWQGRLAREQAGTEWLNKNKGPISTTVAHRSGEMTNTEIRRKAIHGLRR